MARKTSSEMLGEALREMGVLLAVFGPLEHLVIRGESLTPTFALTMVVLVGLLLGMGIAIERLRKAME